MCSDKTNFEGPFRRMLVLGESIAYGMAACRPENGWVQVLASLLRKFQDVELQVFNRSIPGAVISPRCPAYGYSGLPSLIERYRRHCIELEPDLVILAEGLNDMRSGMAVEDFLEDLQTIATGIHRDATALLVLAGMYHQIHGRGNNDPATYPTWSKWSPSTAQKYDVAIRLVAESSGALFADVKRSMGGADWLLHSDCCHLNDLGHVVVGNAVFETIAAHCRGMGSSTLRKIEELGVTAANAGGADTDEETRSLWREAAARRGATLAAGKQAER